MKNDNSPNKKKIIISKQNKNRKKSENKRC